MKHPKLLSIVLSLCAFASALAQPSPYRADQAQSDEEEEVVVLSAFNVSSQTVDRYRAADAVSAVRIRTELIETPSSISVLTRDFMEDIAPVRIFDAAKYTAGVQQGPGSTYGDTVRIRGFLTWGRTVDNFGDGLAYNYEEALIERLEVSKGPNAILSPGGNPGGTVNIVTKAPEFKRKRSLTALIGQFDAQKMTLDITEPIGGSDRFAYRLITAYQDSERYWSSDARLRNKVIAPQFTWRISPSTELVTRYHYYVNKVFREPALILDSSVTQRGQEPILGAEFSYKGLNGMPKWSELWYSVHNAQFQLSHTFNEYLTTRFAGVFRRFEEKSDQSFLSPSATMANRYNPYTGAATPGQTWALQDPSSNHDEVLNPYVATDSPYYDPTAIPLIGQRVIEFWNESYELQNDWVLKYNFAYADLQTVAGVAYSHSLAVDKRVHGSIAPINMLDLANHDDTPTWNTVLDRSSRNTGTNWQIYINQRVSFWGNRIGLTGGYLKYDTETRSIDKATTNPESVLDASKDLYVASALVRLSPSASVYYSYSINASPFGANFQVRWREGKQREWGAKMEFLNRRLAVNVAHFKISLTNGEIWNLEYAAGDLTQPGAFVMDFNNHGTEIEINGALTKTLSVLGSFTHLRMRDPYGRHVNSISGRLGSVLLNYRFHEGTLKGLGLSAGFNYIGEQAGDTPQVDFTPLGVLTQNSYFIPSHTTWNAGATYAWNRYELRLIVDNLTDDKNYVSGAGGRFSQHGLAVATGRNIRLAATVKF